ncbi:hypothetical protein [Patulibacter minatonensis]|uniref:hypothetical protein n=1 Tax=Patulibacter minatonensis TaxID=298163 RepID=UPI00047DBFD4|nr:hypothetical protein [Patulibacter minatonensis]
MRAPGPVPRTTARWAGLLVLAAAGAGLVGCGGDDTDSAQRKVVTTDAGTVIVRTITDRDGLKVEAQGSSLYASFTEDTPATVRTALQGTPLAVSCTLRDGKAVPAFQLLWRDDAKDWGASLEVQGAYEAKEPFASEARSCTVGTGSDARKAVFVDE